MIVASIQAGSAVYSNPNHTHIDCLVSFEGYAAPLPYTASSDDPEQHGQDIWQRLQAGEAGAIADAPEPPLPSMPDLTDRQFARGLRDEGIISFTECVAFVGPGTIPAPLQTILDGIPDQAARENAIIDVTGAQTYEFGNPLVEFVRAALHDTDPKWTPAYLRDRWQAWAGL